MLWSLNQLIANGMHKISPDVLRKFKKQLYLLPPLFLLLASFFSAGFQSFHSTTKPGQTGTVVYAFLMEDCPISQHYTLELKQLYQSYANNGLEFIGVFANASSTEETIQAFQKKYALPFLLKLDADNKIFRALGAQISPEVFVVDKASNKILYQGRIDNAFLVFIEEEGYDQP
jgi:peroxiredoxin